jgi:DNA-binding NarL/FixJ family response regulator
MRVIRILIADDHLPWRQNLAQLLGQQPDMEVVGEAADGDEAVLQARKLQPDVIIMDLNMPRLSGIEATRLIAVEMPKVCVIGFSLRSGEGAAAAMRKAGAAAYLAKGCPIEDLLAAIRAGRP